MDRVDRITQREQTAFSIFVLDVHIEKRIPAMPLWCQGIVSVTRSVTKLTKLSKHHSAAIFTLRRF